MSIVISLPYLVLGTVALATPTVLRTYRRLRVHVW